MIYLVVAALVLLTVTVLWLLRLFVEADPGKLAQGLRQFFLALGIAISGGALAFGLISERVPVALAGVAGLVPCGLSPAGRGAGGERPNQCHRSRPIIWTSVRTNGRGRYPGWFAAAAFKVARSAICRGPSSSSSGGNAALPTSRAPGSSNPISIASPLGGDRRMRRQAEPPPPPP